jgi:membrane dipeptidase
MRVAGVFAILGILLPAVMLLHAQDTGSSERAKRVHARAIVIDTHIDVPATHARKPDYDVGVRHSEDHVDLPRMREGGLDAAFFSIYMPATVTGPEAVKRSLELIDWAQRQVERNADTATLVTTAAGIRQAHKQGKLAILMGMEGGHMIDDSLAALRAYAALGVRYLTLTHGRGTNWAGSSGDASNTGLTDLGREVVLELNRLGVLVDLSHVSDQTFNDALAVTMAPVVLSHSSCRAICDHPRNVTDDMLRALARNGGVIQITFVDSFLSQELRNAERAVQAERDARIAEEQKKYPDDEAARREAARRIRREYQDRMPKVSWEKIIEHIDHAVKVAGVDHVGLGSDFDGATMPQGMEDVTQLPKITDALLKKGYSEKDVEKILGGNLLRVMEQVEQVSRKLQGRKAEKSQ